MSVFNKHKNENELKEISVTKEELKVISTIDNQESILEMYDITVDEVTKAIEHFKPNKSPGIDGITSTYALQIKEIIATPLHYLFNKLIETNEVPEDWKKANITPIFKKGDKLRVENYRPVSLTVLFGKAMEKILKERIEKYSIDSNKINKHSMDSLKAGHVCQICIHVKIQ